MKILIPQGDPFKISNYRSGSGAGFNFITSKEFKRAEKKLEKEIEKRKKDEQ